MILTVVSFKNVDKVMTYCNIFCEFSEEAIPLLNISNVSLDKLFQEKRMNEYENVKKK